MEAKKYRFSLAGLPPQIISKFEGEDVLKLRITTQFGRKDIILHEGEIIRTEDPLVSLQLENYAPPKLPKITRKPKGASVATVMTYEFNDYKDVHPFTVVSNDLPHHLGL